MTGLIRLPSPSTHVHTVPTRLKPRRWLLHRCDAGRRSRCNHISGFERSALGEVRNERRDIEQHVARRSILQNFSIDIQSDTQCVGIWHLIA
ncbi:hypothetical protein V1291_001469 [Nitrobacteraceae bacterium AZCC 1564]